MAFSDYSKTPSANTSIAGQNIAPGGPPSAVGPAVRQIMADGKDLSVSITNVSGLKNIPSDLHAAIAARTNTTDLSSYIQSVINSAPSGANITFPEGLYVLDQQIVVDRSVMITGAATRSDFDNSWDYGDGGTVFHCRGTSGGFLFAPPDAANRSISVTLRDFLVRGGRVSNARTLGHGIEVDGRGQAGTRVKLLMSNVHATETAGTGLYVHGAVYGGSIRDCYFFRNGKRGALFQNGPGDTTGEMSLDQIRCFQNGVLAADDDEGTGFAWLGGHLKAGMISCTDNSGLGMLLCGGSICIDAPHCESNEGGAQIRIGAPLVGTKSVTLDAIEISPGNGYQGAHIHLTSTASGVRLGSGYFGDSIGTGGCHILRDSGSQVLDFGIFAAQVPLSIIDNANDYQTRAVVQVFARLNTAGSTQTGDGTSVDFKPDGEIVDNWASFNPATGVFTAPISAVYKIEAVLPLTGLTSAHNVAYARFQATSYNREYKMGNVGAMRDGGNLFSYQAAATIPMKKGETLKVTFAVAGGTKVVGTTGGGIDGFLSIVTTH